MNGPLTLILRLTVSVGLIVSATAMHAAAPEAGLPEGMARLAQAVDQFFVDERLDKAIVLGTFTSPGGDGNSQLRVLLEQNLKRVGFEIKARSAHSISGRFLKDFLPNGGNNAVALKVKAEIRDNQDEVVQPFSIPIFGDGAVAMLGPTAELPTSGPTGTEPQRQEGLNEALDHPQVAVVGDEVRATSSSPFGIEIVVGRTGRKPKVEDGLAFVSLAKGDEYAIRLHNRTAFEVAVALTIDGLSMFAFSEDGNFGSQTLIPAGGSIDIPGWYINDQRSAAFEITTLGEGAAAIKGVTGSIGVITAKFSAAWDPKAKPPADELLARSAYNSTGLGRPLEKKYQTVERVIGRTRAFVSVRYDR